MLNRLMRWLNHRHEWLYAGPDESSTEGKWYWHLEECRWCPRVRIVMNDPNCDCGGN